MKGKKLILGALVLGTALTLGACDEKEEEVNSYSITFKNGDTIISTDKVKEGNYFKIPQNPTKDGYVFAGWDVNGDNVADQIAAATADATYSALFVDSQLAKTVTFKADGTEVAKVYYAEGVTAIVEPSVPQKAGYVGEWEEYTLDGNIEVNAVYTLAEYTVTFKADGVVVGHPQKYTINNKTIQAPLVPEKEGYIGTWEPYTLTTGDVVVNAVYTEKDLTLANLAGNYIVDGENVIVYGDAIQVGKFYTYVSYDNKTDDNPYYYTINGNILNLYNYNNEVDYSFIYSEGRLYKYIAKESVDYYGTYKYTNNGVEQTLTITDDSVVYNDGTNEYTNYYLTDYDVYEGNYSTLVVITDSGSLSFTMDSNYDITCDDKIFAKQIPQEYLGLYSFASNYIYITENSAVKLTATGIYYNYSNYTYDSTTGNLSDGYNTYVKMTKSTMPQKYYGTYRSFNQMLLINSDGCYIDDTKCETVEFYQTSNDSEYAFIILDGVVYSYSASFFGGMITDSYWNTFYPSYAGDVSNKTLPASWSTVDGVLLDYDGTKLKVTSSSVEFSDSSYSDLQYFFNEDKLYIFADSTYKLSTQKVFELAQDGNGLLCDGSLYAPFNVNIAGLYATYASGDKQIVISEDGINYNGTNYTEYSINAYDIKLTDEIVLTYDESEGTLYDGTDTYSQVIDIPTEWVGEYSSEWDSSVKYVIATDGVTYIEGGTSYNCKIKSINKLEKTITLSYELWKDYIQTFTLSINDNSTLTATDENGNETLFSMASDEPVESDPIPTQWEGLYADEFNNFELNITSSGLLFNHKGWGSTSNVYTITGNTLTVFVDGSPFTMTYDETNTKFVLDVGGMPFDLLLKNNDTPAPSVTMPLEWVGTYTDNLGWNMIVVITENKVTIDSSEYSIQSVDGNTVVITDSWTTKTLVFDADGNFVIDGDIEYNPVAK